MEEIEREADQAMYTQYKSGRDFIDALAYPLFYGRDVQAGFLLERPGEYAVNRVCLSPGRTHRIQAIFFAISLMTTCKMVLRQRDSPAMVADKLGVSPDMRALAASTSK